jgi:hypothetical protein
VTSTGRARALLSGPRGRRLCLSLALASADERTWPPLRWTDGSDGYPIGRFDLDDVRSALVAAVEDTDLSTLAGATDPAAFLPALLDSVDSARYWQEPDDVPGVDGPARTLLGGWDPDATWWLTDVVRGIGEPTDWRRQDDEPPRWAAVS